MLAIDFDSQASLECRGPFGELRLCHCLEILPGSAFGRGHFLIEESRLAASLHEYELVVVLSPELQEDAVTGGIDKVHQAITSRGGQIDDVNNWGRRRLAYPIKRHLEGTYVVTQMKLDPTQVVDLENNLRISEDVIRHLVIRTDE
jgi:small subunit ribosomal protein S6